MKSFLYLQTPRFLYVYKVSGLVFTTRRNSLFNFLVNSEEVVVVFIPLYILAGFYICSSQQYFPLISIHYFCVSKISHLSFSISMYHIFYIFHRLDRFSGSFFPMSSLPASLRYFSQSVSSFLPCPSVITFSQFVASYFSRIFFCQMSHTSLDTEEIIFSHEILFFM